MPAQKLNLTGDNRIEQGATFEIEIVVKDADGSLYDLSASTCEAQIRETKDASTATDFGVAIDTVTSTITLTLTAVETAAIDFTSGYWDCELTTGAVVVRLLEGSVTISQEVTK